MPRDELRDTSMVIGDLIASLSDEEFTHLIATDSLDDYVNDGLEQYEHQTELMTRSDAIDEELERRNAEEKAELAAMTDEDWAQLHADAGMSAVEYQAAGDDHTERELAGMVDEAVDTARVVMEDSLERELGVEFTDDMPPELARHLRAVPDLDEDTDDDDGCPCGDDHNMYDDDGDGDVL